MPRGINAMINLDTLLVDFNKIIDMPELPQNVRKKKLTREISAVELISRKSPNGNVILPWVGTNTDLLSTVTALHGHVDREDTIDVDDSDKLGGTDDFFAEALRKSIRSGSRTSNSSITASTKSDQPYASSNLLNIIIPMRSHSAQL